MRGYWSRRSLLSRALRPRTSPKRSGLGTPGDAVGWLIETEEEAIDALQAAIEPTGREGRSEALEHTLEHLIMRKQNQVDFLLRARRQS